MRRHLLIGRLGLSDRTQVARGLGEVATRVELSSGDAALGNGVGKALSDLAALGAVPTPIGIDLLVLASLVYAADTRVSRSSESQDGWTRELRLAVPVSDPGRWTDVAPTLVRMLDFLTGDRWAILFHARPKRFADPTARLTVKSGPSFDALSLLSGGLDSLVGALDTLESGHVPLFVSHAGDGATSDAQRAVFKGLRAAYPQQTFGRLRLWTAFPQRLVRGSAGEDTTRGRSFLFFALGVFAGTGLGGPFTLDAPENGLIALNVPLDPIRLGALSTRTTHPFYMARWNDLLAGLGVQGRVNNPYWDKTKGEMMAGCAAAGHLRSLAPLSLSCSSPNKGRWKGFGIQHCGYCLPCLIRRAAYASGLGANADPTTYTLDDLTARALDTTQAEGQQVRSFQLAAARLRGRPGVEALLIHKPGPLTDESPARRAALADVYRRGLLEVDALLAGATAEPSS